MCFFLSSTRFSLPAAGLFSRSRLRGTQGGRLYTTVKVWVTAGLRGACSGRSPSRNLSKYHVIAVRRAGADQAHGNPQSVFFYYERGMFLFWAMESRYHWFCALLLCTSICYYCST